MNPMIILRMPRLVLTVTLLLAGCGNAPPAAEADLGPRTETIYLIHRGWHTDIGLTIDKAGESFARLRGKFPDARTLVFGFGDRAYLLHRTYGIGEMLATLLPGPGTVLVTGLRQPPREAFSDQGVSALQVTTAGLARLDEFIAGSLEREPDGAPRDIGVGPYPDSN